MAGLYHRAVDYIANQRKLRIVEPDEFGEPDDDSEDDVSPEERREILERIDAIVSRNRLEVGPDTFTFKAKRRGGVLPGLVNLVALLVLAAGIVAAILYFDRQEQTIASVRPALVSAEGRLLKAVQEESKQRLAEKNQEIAGIRDQLQGMDAERERLLAETEQRIAEREGELRASLAQDLEAERTRLREGGLSEEAVNQRLAAFEQQKESEYQDLAQSIREEAALQLQEREAALESLISEYEGSLASAETEIQQIQQEVAARETELESEFEARRAALEEETSQALERLDDLQRQQDRERLVLDQTVGFYDRTQASLQNLDFAAALGSLAALRTYLNQVSVAELPGIQNRRRVEMFLISSLEDLIQTQRDSESEDARSLVESASLVAAVTKLVEQANTSFEDERYLDARELYLSALSEIPAVNVGYTRLQEIQERFAGEERSQIASSIARGNDRYLAGDFAAAVSEYTSALDALPAIENSAAQLLDRVMDAGYQMRSVQDLANLEILRNELEDLQEQNSAIAAESEGRRTALEDALEENAAVQAERDASKGELERLLEQYRALQTAEETQLAKVTSLEETVQRLQPLETELERVTGLSRAAESKVAEQATRIAALQAETERIPALEAELEDAKLELTDIGFLRTEVQRLESVEESLGELQASVDEYRKAYEERQAIATRIDRFRPSTGSSPIDGRTTADEGSASEMEILQTKLLLMKVANLQPVRSEYPDFLYQMNGFLVALMDQERSAAGIATLKEVNEMLDDIIASDSTIDVSGAAGESSGEPTQADLLSSFLDKLQQFLE